MCTATEIVEVENRKTGERVFRGRIGRWPVEMLRYLVAEAGR
jgi:hypothetical protein